MRFSSNYVHLTCYYMFFAYTHASFTYVKYIYVIHLRYTNVWLYFYVCIQICNVMFIYNISSIHMGQYYSTPPSYRPINFIPLTFKKVISVLYISNIICPHLSFDLTVNHIQNNRNATLRQNY